MTRQGFTSIELLVTTAILVIVFALGAGVFSLIQQTAAAASGTVALEQIIGGAARRARSGASGTSWGVYIPYDETTRHTDSVVIFSGDSYATRVASRDVSYRFNEGVEFVTVDWSGAGASLGNDHEVVFFALNGETTQYGTVTMRIYGQIFTLDVTEDGFVVPNN